MSLLFALETKEPAPSARVPPSRAEGVADATCIPTMYTAPDPAPPPPGSAPGARKKNQACGIGGGGDGGSGVEYWTSDPWG